MFEEDIRQYNLVPRACVPLDQRSGTVKLWEHQFENNQNLVIRFPLRTRKILSEPVDQRLLESSREKMASSRAPVFHEGVKFSIEKLGYLNQE